MSSGASPAEADRVVSVIPLVPVWRLDRALAYKVPPELSDRVVAGCLVSVPLGGRNVRGIVVGEEPDTSERDLQSVGRIVLTDPLTPPPLDELFDWVARRYAVPRGKALARAVPPRVRMARAEAIPIKDGPQPKRLTAYTGAKELWNAVRSGRPGAWLLQSLPGEDRGALIAELATPALESGRGGVLVAVPEIAHGSLVIDGLTGVFGDVARVDSRVGDVPRAQSWMRLAAGHPLGAGGRATVLAPVPRLSLIVLDEEHHRSYKEDRGPRYDARRVALERARLQGAVCVLVSSCPSVETGAAAHLGEIGWVRPARADLRAARPIVEVVDPSTDRVVSTLLHDRIKRTLNDGGHVALLAPARGYARVVWCAVCRRSIRCERCETPMAFEHDRLECPSCRHSITPPPSGCPYCSAPRLVHLGAGSERVAEQVASAFPRARVRHIAADTLQSDEPAEIYVTTWIGTKESLRPNVSLVGILNADALIRRPDWRAAEDAYQALAEMAEWAGPAGSGGRLVVQTSDARHHAVQAVARADYRHFLDAEMEQRRELQYPPHRELARVTAQGPRAHELIAAVREKATASGALVLGPVPVPGRRPHGQGSRDALEILLKCVDARVVAEALRDILAGVRGRDSLAVDVDPN